MKRCSKCGIEKPITMFYLHKTGRDGHRADCKVCCATRNRAWLDKNQARHRTHTTAWRKANPIKAAASVKKWNSEHPERAAGNWARYAKAHAAEKNARRSERRARQRRATPAWANKFFIEEIYDLARRRTQTTGIKWEVDHIVPMNHPLVQGLHVEHNLQVIPQQHNRSKHNRYWPNMPQEAS